MSADDHGNREARRRSPEMITQYRTTKKLPKLDTFAKLCKELDLDAAYILGLTKD